jgi:hypothetical protein
MNKQRGTEGGFEWTFRREGGVQNKTGFDKPVFLFNDA